MAAKKKYLKFSFEIFKNLLKIKIVNFLVIF